jgi:hypothetical protein
VKIKINSPSCEIKKLTLDEFLRLFYSLRARGSEEGSEATFEATSPSLRFPAQTLAVSRCEKHNSNARLTYTDAKAKRCAGREYGVRPHGPAVFPRCIYREPSGSASLLSPHLREVAKARRSRRKKNASSTFFFGSRAMSLRRPSVLVNTFCYDASRIGFSRSECAFFRAGKIQGSPAMRRELRLLLHSGTDIRSNFGILVIVVSAIQTSL